MPSRRRTMLSLFESRMRALNTDSVEEEDDDDDYDDFFDDDEDDDFYDDDEDDDGTMLGQVATGHDSNASFENRPVNLPPIVKPAFLDEEVDLNLDPDLEAIITDDEHDLYEPEAKRLRQDNFKTDKIVKEECAICLFLAELPVRMPCSHVFCFTCARGMIKGQDKSCALCRKPIPPNFITNPETFATRAVEAPMGKYSWFYKSRSGWWAYAPRMQTDIESVFQSGQSTFECILNGKKYFFDFILSIQTFGMYKKKIQHIKRGLSKSSHLGVAGLRYTVPS